MNVKRRELNAEVSSSVDDFFKERQIKRENYTPREVVVTMLAGGLYRVGYIDGGGELGPEISGMFTSIREAERAVSAYKQKCLDKQR